MARLTLTLSFLLLSLLAAAQQPGIIINEISNGSSGVQEYYELLVVGPPCGTVDLREWIVDDNNGDFGAGSGQGIASGHVRFVNTANWSNVPVGSLILIYNDADANPAITLADDPTDSNNDQVYVLPVSNSSLEQCIDMPSTSSPSYMCALFSAADWGRLGLRNAGDAAQTREPNGDYFHGIGYGSLNGGPDNLHVGAGSGSNSNFYFSGTSYTDVADFEMGSVPNGDETPGMPNDADNAAYITALQAGGSQSQDLLGPDQPICDGQPIALTPGPSFDTYLWSDGSTASSLTVAAAGLYAVTVTAAGGCSITDTIAISTGASPMPDLGPDVVVCPDSNATLYPGQTYTTIEWNTGATTDSLLVSNAGVYAVTVTNTAGCSGSDTVVVSLPGNGPELGADIVTCNDTTFVVDPGSFVNYFWSNGSTDSSQTIVLSGGPLTSLSVTVTDAGGCVWRDTITYQKLAPPNPQLGNDTALCIGDGITLDPGTFVSYDWSTGITQPTLFVNFPSTFWVQVSNGACSARDSITLNYLIPNLGFEIADTVLCPGQTIAVDATIVEDGVVYQWSTGTTRPIENISEVGSYSITWTNECGTASESFSVTQDVDCEATWFVPNVLTPNGDGQNDTWRLETNRIAELHVTIFNRWGRSVFETNRINEEWDGRKKGREVPSGTYFYVLTLTPEFGEPVSESGYIMLLRN